MYEYLSGNPKNGSGGIWGIQKFERNWKTVASLSKNGNWMGREQFINRDGRVFVYGILGLVTRLVKWAVSEHNLPSGNFSIHSLRSGGATCLYHSGVNLEYIRRFGRWRSSTFSIYLHFDDKVLRKLPTRLMESECLMSQLKVCTDASNKTEFDDKGGKVRITIPGKEAAGNVGQPTSLPTEKRTGIISNQSSRSLSRSVDSVQTNRSSAEAKTVIPSATMRHLRDAKVLWGILSHPEYAHDDDGPDAVVKEETLYYAIQGKVFAGEAFCSQNFRVAKIVSRDVRRALVAAGKAPADQTTLGEYQIAYRQYITARRRNRREDLIEKFRKELSCRVLPPVENQTGIIDEPASSSVETDKGGIESMRHLFTRLPDKDVWKWVEGKRRKVRRTDEPGGKKGGR